MHISFGITTKDTMIYKLVGRIADLLSGEPSKRTLLLSWIVAAGVIYRFSSSSYGKICSYLDMLLSYENSYYSSGRYKRRCIIVGSDDCKRYLNPLISGELCSITTLPTTISISGLFTLIAGILKDCLCIRN